MILVTLGTQDKSFHRLLEAVETEIKKGTIKEPVIVQAGCTKFSSSYMEIFDYKSPEELEQLMKDCSLLITHAGVGSIMMGLKQKKKMIVASRLQKYKEHTNDHQQQIASLFAKEGYLLELKDFTQLGKLLQKSQTFQPRPFKSNSENIQKVIAEFIETEESMKKESLITKGKKLYQKYKEVILYLIFGVLTTLVNIVSYGLLTRMLHLDTYVSNVLAWFLSVLFAFITNKLFVFESKDRSFKTVLKEGSSFFGFRLLSLGFDMLAMYVMISIFHVNDLIAKVISNVIVIILNYIFSKLFIFKKKEVK